MYLKKVNIHQNTIIGIEKNIPAPKNNSNLPTYSPPSEVDYVLEVASGWTDQNKIQTGDLIKF